MKFLTDHFIALTHDGTTLAVAQNHVAASHIGQHGSIHFTSECTVIRGVQVLCTEPNGCACDGLCDRAQVNRGRTKSDFNAGIIPDAAPEDLPFDVLMEIWFPDQGRMDAAMALIASEAAQKEIIADEARLFDRELIRSYVVEEYESEMP